MAANICALIRSALSIRDIASATSTAWAQSEGSKKQRCPLEPSASNQLLAIGCQSGSTAGAGTKSVPAEAVAISISGLFTRLRTSERFGTGPGMRITSPGT